MDQKLLSFVIETLLLRPRGQRAIVPQGYPMPAQPSDCELDAETIAAMRELIVNRITNNVGAMADAFVERIKFSAGARMDACDSIMFELCDEVVSPSKWTMTQQISPISPALGSALAQALSANLCPYVQPSADASNEVLKAALAQQNNYIYCMQLGINGLMQAMLSSKPYDPFMILRDCKSKVVILHDGPDKDKLRAIADEKKMVVLTDSMKRDRSESPRTNSRPELMLLLMLNAYNSASVANNKLFPKQDRRGNFLSKWAPDNCYLDVERYINNTVENYVNCSYSIREELERKAPEFLKDFDEDLYIIHSEDDLINH